MSKQPPMDCDQMLRAMSDHLDGDDSSPLVVLFRKHLGECSPCQVVVDNVKGTIQLYQDGEPYEVPQEFRERLHSKLRDRWKKAFGNGDSGD